MTAAGWALSPRQSCRSRRACSGPFSNRQALSSSAPVGRVPGLPRTGTPFFPHPAKGPSFLAVAEPFRLGRGGAFQSWHPTCPNPVGADAARSDKWEPELVLTPGKEPPCTQTRRAVLAITHGARDGYGRMTHRPNYRTADSETRAGAADDSASNCHRYRGRLPSVYVGVK